MFISFRSLLTAVTVFLCTTTFAVASITPVSAVPTISTGEFTFPGFPTTFYRVYFKADFSATVTSSDPNWGYTIFWDIYGNENGVGIFQTQGSLMVLRGSTESQRAPTVSLTWVANRTYDGTAMLRTASGACVDSQTATYTSGPTFSIYPPSP